MWRASDKYTKKPFSQLKQTEFYGICGKRSAAEYTQSEIMLANWQALLRSICGRQAKYTKKPFSQLKQTEFHGIFGKRSAAEYMKSENHVGKLTGDAAQYMWRVSDKYTKKPT